MKKILKKKNFFLIVVIFILGLFAYVTYKTPLAGDDWGYALNGSLGTPFKTAFEFYKNWSGRFFSELWGMIVPCHKYLWNIINPLLFCGIFICIYKLGRVNKKPIISALLILAFMLSVDDNLRMETYTWIMGTTYVIPLFFSLLYFVIVNQLFDGYLYSNKLKVACYLSNILLFIIGLMMENIAATMIVAVFILCLYAWFNKRQALKYLLINLAISTISFIILRASPGSAYRLENDNAAWMKLSLFEKISTAYPNFLQMTFINNNYAILLFSLCLIGLMVYTKNEVSKKCKVVSIIISLLGILNVFYFVIGDSFINNSSSTYSFIFWSLYIVNAFVTIYLGVETEFKRYKTIFLLMVAGCNALVMLYSPIYGSRSAIYTVYYLIVVSVLINEEFKSKKIINLFVIAILMFINCDRTIEYISKYKLVGIRNNERLEVIKYYQEHPEDEEAWIPRFPVYTIHGADIEPDDTYHLETFKEYYNLPQDADKIIFYFVEED